jgi:energy-coupling factor transporter transmembrane protein EcfT
MKIRKDLALALATFEGAMLALFVAMPTWLLAVIITLTVVAAALTVTTIWNARKASYNEEAKKHDYRFPIWKFVIGAALLAALTAAIVLVTKKLFGFALIPVAVILAALLAIATIKKLKIMKLITALLLVLLVLFFINYGTSYLVHNGVNLNPGLNTSAPVEDETQKPNDETQAPGDETQTPGDETQTPGDETQTPGDETQTPGDETTTPPAVTVKINAPETLSYGNPVTVTLEGCKVDDLVFGNSDFIAISKISDTEVSIILVGIVNETTGQVEIVPASGYITITDSVSGTNVTINIVE